MASKRDYIINIRGDTSEVMAAAAKVGAKFEKIADTKFKLHFDSDVDETVVKPIMELAEKSNLKFDVQLEAANIDDLKNQLKVKNDLELDLSDKSFKKTRDKITKRLEGLLDEIYAEQDKIDEQEEKGIASSKIDRSSYYKKLREAAYYKSGVEDSISSGAAKDLLSELNRILDAEAKIKHGFEEINRSGDKINLMDFKDTSKDTITEDLRESTVALAEAQAKLDIAINNPVKFTGGGIEKLVEETKELAKAKEEAASVKTETPVDGDASAIQKEVEATEKLVEVKKEAAQVDSVLEESKKKTDETQRVRTEADVTSELIEEQKKLIDLQEKRSKVSRKVIEDDKAYNVYKTKNDDVENEEELGLFLGKEIKQRFVKSGYKHKGYGRWISKGGATEYQLKDLSDELWGFGNDNLDKLDSQILNTESRISDLNKELRGLEKTKREALEPAKSNSDGFQTEEVEKQTRALNDLKEAKEKASEPVESKSTDSNIAEIEKQTQALKEFEDAKESASQSGDLGVAASASGARQEESGLNGVEEAANAAAEAKERFAQANEKLLASVVQSLSGIENEGKAFQNLNKLLNNVGSERGQQKVELLKKSLEELYAILKQDMSGVDAPLSKSLENLLKDGDSIKALASVLKSSKKDIDKAESQASGNGKMASDASVEKRLSSLREYEERMEHTSGASDELRASIKELYNTLEGGNVTSKALVGVDEQIKKIKASVKELEDIDKQQISQLQKNLSGYDKRLEKFDKKRYATTYTFGEGNNKEEFDLAKKVNKVRGLLKELKDDSGSFKIDLNSDEVQKRVAEIIEEMAKVDAALNDPLANPKSVANLEKQMADFANKNHRLTTDIINDVERLRKALKGKDLTSSQYGEIFSQFREQQTKAADQDLIGGKGLLENLGGRIKQMNTNFIGMFFSFYDIVRYAKQIAGAVTEVDTALVELRKVSDASNERIQQSFENSAATAKELGATVTDVINSTSDWARLGYSVDQAESLARVTQLYQNVGDNMTQEDASQSLISTMKGYQKDVSEAESVVDKFNEVFAARLCRRCK